jgi:signal transduction histidine kinase
MESEVGLPSLVAAAHEMKGPLATLRQLALFVPLARSEEELRRISEEMVGLSERALRQVNDLTKCARLTDAMFPMEPVSPRQVCDEVARSLDALYRFNKRELRFNYRNRARLVVANPELLYSVVYNFGLNAAHYSGEEMPSEIFVKDYRGKVRIGVRDFGPALPNDLRRAIATGFLKKPTSIAMRPGSSGLGLYIASKFTEFMRGKIGVVQHRDGTSFYVDLMASRQAMLWG